MSEKIHHAETQYGFEYGSLTVERLISHKGTVIVGLTTPKVKGLRVYATRTGKVRIFLDNEELCPKPTSKKPRRTRA